MSLRLGFSLLVALFLSPSLWAAECAGVNYPDKDSEFGIELKLNGLGLREATVFAVDVYVAALYVEKKSLDGSAIINSEGPKKLILKFVREVPKKDISDAWSEGFRKTTGSNIEKLRTRITELNGWMDDMRIGSVITFIIQDSPLSSQLDVEINGNRKGTIKGRDFVRPFLSIWLGKEPPNPGLKAGLLGGSCG